MTQSSQNARATITFHTTVENKERLERLAAATQRSRSFLSNEALTNYLKAEEDFILSVERGEADKRAGQVHDTDAAKKVIRDKINGRKRST